MTIVPSPSRGTNSEPRLSPRIVVADRDEPDERQGRPREPQPRVEQRLEEPVGQAVDERLLVGCLPRQPERGQHGHQRQRQDHRARQGEDDRQRHRPEQLPLDPLERQDRQVDDHDDQLAEHRRLADLDGRVADDVELLPAGAVVGQVPDAVLDHHDRAIDDQAEVDRAQAHQAAGDPDPFHHRDGEEHRQRDRRGDDQPGPEVAEEGEQHGDDQDGPLEQVPLDGLEHLVDQVGPLVNDRRPRRRAGRAFFTSCMARSRAIVTSREFSPIRMKARPRTTSPLPLAVTPPRRIAWPTPTSATSLTRIGTPSRAVMTILPISSTERARPTPWIRLDSPARDDVAAADVLVVLLQGPDHVVERQAVLGQLHRVGPDLELLGQPAPGVDLGHARHPPEPGPDHPVLERAEARSGRRRRWRGCSDRPRPGRSPPAPSSAARSPAGSWASPSRSLICCRAK